MVKESRNTGVLFFKNKNINELISEINFIVSEYFENNGGADKMYFSASDGSDIFIGDYEDETVIDQCIYNSKIVYGCRGTKLFNFVVDRISKNKDLYIVPDSGDVCFVKSKNY